MQVKGRKLSAKHITGVFLIIAGLGMLCACGGMIYSEVTQERAAEQNVTRAMEEVQQNIQSSNQASAPVSNYSSTKAVCDALIITPTPDTDGAMPVMQINGREYIGYIEMPTIEIDLPVQSAWSYPNLKISPCLYSGSTAGSMVLLAHNYASHFGRIKNLRSGDPVQFVDADGRIYKYVVDNTEVLSSYSVPQMTTSDYDLTLFTCTNGGSGRLAVRLRSVLRY